MGPVKHLDSGTEQTAVSVKRDSKTCGVTGDKGPLNKYTFNATVAAGGIIPENARAGCSRASDL